MEQKQPLQRRDDFGRPNGTVDANVMALPRILVQHVEHAQLATAFRAVFDEVVAPHVIGILGLHGNVRRRPTGPFPLALSSTLQPFFLPKPMYPFPVYPPSLAFQFRQDPAHSVARVLLGKLADALAQRRLIAPNAPFIPHRHPWRIHQCARTAFTASAPLHQILGHVPFGRGAYHFFALISFKSWISRAWSATSFFNRLFSSSSCLSR